MNTQKPDRIPFNPDLKAELLERITRSRDALEDLIDPLDDEQLNTPGPSGWSIKDHLAHLAVWELGIAELLRQRPRFEAMQVAEAVSQGQSEDEINALIQAQHAELSASEVLDKFHQAHRQLIAAVETLEPEDLYKPYAAYAPADQNAPQEPVFGWIVGNTFGHFDEHAGYIRALLEEFPANPRP